MTRIAPIALAAALVAVSGCGGGEPPAERSPAPAATPARSPAPSWPRRVRCPAAPAGTNCKAARGTILYVERVDPDGDGDAHFVLASSDSVTAPGLTVIDVEKRLRPHPLPGPGDRVSAAGPVYRGSHGQRQIQATELKVSFAP
jgi:hypothetical protein